MERLGAQGQITYARTKPETSEPRGRPLMALILACYSLGHKRSQTSYYSNTSPHKVSMLGGRWKRFPYIKKDEIN